ncbi:hypothetical protein BK769_31195 [Bacillus thuringiensis serovar kumamtoensis]|uniref:Uncharacterized protein n=1 Tax=Bacillus thuringiensis serovar kumamotoensis TaxID=132267 RepID=A0A9X6PN68_BACUK|nr:hypothetical protein BK769_31195 [Bacillus thuringiensis serovar kumamtoensis]
MYKYIINKTVKLYIFRYYFYDINSVKKKGRRENLPITIMLISAIYISIIIMSEHALNSQRYRGITDDIHFLNHKIGFTYMKDKSPPN